MKRLILKIRNKKPSEHASPVEAEFSTFSHLPSVSDGVVAPVKVPCVGGPYKGANFFEYPHNCGVNHPLLFEGVHPGLSPAAAEAFVQEWLFFGALVEVFRLVFIEVQQTDFVTKHKEQGLFITTQALTAYIRQWQQTSSRFSRQESVAKAIQIKRILALISLFAKRHVASSGRLTAQGLVRPEIGLSLVILATTLENASFHILIEPYPTGSGYTLLPWFPIDLLKLRLLQSGLCPATVQELQLTVSPDTQYYIGSLPQPQNKFDHSSCEIARCLVGNINETEYNCKHVWQECKSAPCGYRSIDISQLNSIIATADGIPVVFINDENGKTGFELELSNITEDTKYIAVSHVWAHGIGNPRSNSLPSCVLNYITPQVNRVATQEHLSAYKIGFWIDTLCVPVGSEHEAMRRRAITQMERIYKNAARVLVFDAGLQQICAPKSIVELRYQILLSDWYHRLWTPQEAVLATRVCFAFRDTVVSFDDLEDAEGERFIRMQLPGGDFALSNLVFDGSSRVFFRVLRRFEDGNLSNERGLNLPRFAVLPRLLSGRKTSRPEDEPICLALLLGFAVDEILPIKDQERRMKALYSKLDRVPPDVLFYSGPKLSFSGFSWAPTSFLGPLNRGRLNTNVAGLRSARRLDDTGLESPYPALFLYVNGQQVNNLPPTSRIFVYDNNPGRWLMITTYTENAEGFEEPHHESLPNLHDPAIVIREYTITDSRTGALQTGAIVSIQNRSEKETVSKYFCLVTVRELIGQANHEWANRKWPFLDSIEGQSPRITSDRIVCDGVRRDPERSFWIA